jgi:hypothetical protein
VILAVLCLALGVMLIPSVKAVFLDPAVEVLKTGAQSGETFLGI